MDRFSLWMCRVVLRGWNRMSANWRACALGLGCMAVLCGCGGGGDSGDVEQPAAPTPVHPVEGNLLGLQSGQVIVELTHPGGPTAVTRSGDGDFTFAELAEGQAFSARVSEQPEGHVCGVTANATGSVSSSGAPKVEVRCQRTFTVGGTVNGLRGAGLVLQLESTPPADQIQPRVSEQLPLAAAGAFTFATALENQSGFVVSIVAQPQAPAQTCTLSAGAVGSIADADDLDVVVDCVDELPEYPARRWRMHIGPAEDQPGFDVLDESANYPAWSREGGGRHTVEAGRNVGQSAFTLGFEDDDIANIEVYSGNLGRTYWVTAEAAHTGSDAGQDPQGKNDSVSSYAQRQSYRKSSAEAAMRLKITKLLLGGFDFEDFSASGHRKGDYVMSRADLAVVVSRGAESDANAMVVDQQNLNVVLWGRDSDWDHRQYLKAASSGRIHVLDLEQTGAIVFLDDVDADGVRSDAVLMLVQPLNLDLDLSDIAVGEEFTVELQATAHAHDPSDRDTGFAASFLRDPAKTTGVEPGGARTASALARRKARAAQVAAADPDTLGYELETEGVEVTNRPFLGEPELPAPEPVACTVGGDAGTVQFDATAYATTEAASYNVRPVFLTRTGGSSGELEVTVESVGGTATVDADYRPLSQRVRWSDGDTLPRLVELRLIPDADIEADETVELQLSNPACGTLGAVASATLTIVSEDTAEIPVYSVSGTVSGLEGTGLVIREGLNEIAVTANGPFAFPADLLDGWDYDVRVKVQPLSPRQICSVTNGKGTIDASDVTNVLVTCVTSTEPGSLDPAFGNDGVASDEVLVRGVQEMALHADGRIVVADSYKRVARYSRDGVLDTSFGTAGEAQVIFSGQDTDEVRALALQPDGKIVVAGFSRAGISDDDDFAVARLNADGTLDSTFGTGGKVITDFFGFFDRAHFVLVQPDGRIVVGGEAYTSLAGNSELALVRYLADGSPDPSFGTAGKVLADLSARDAVYAAALRADGRILIAGGFGTAGSDLHADSVLAQYLPDGTVDESFGVHGIRAIDLSAAGMPGPTSDWIGALLLDASDRIVTLDGNGGGGGFRVARFTPDGELDSTFGSGGVTRVEFDGDDVAGQDLALTDDGRIVVAGWRRDGVTFRTDFAVAALDDGGALDPNFATGGKFVMDFFGADDGAYQIALQDGRMVVGGLAISGSTRLAALLRLVP
ncbi:MAG TPA: Calx-beta domain-containing protein [Steroidobacteraceae bacterium]|nr:Calx-beta domain-containing protein [Steroidobacteraceae bacterium]